MSTSLMRYYSIFFQLCSVFMSGDSLNKPSNLTDQYVKLGGGSAIIQRILLELLAVLYSTVNAKDCLNILVDHVHSIVYCLLMAA